jgi:UDP-N-acetylmuramoyl-tripeptide--D-alanyl-D-alanine ligase
VILGEMKELGEKSVEEHQKLLNFLSQQSFDRIYLVGDIFRKLNTTHLFFENVEVLIQSLQKEPVNGHYILLKGSHSVHLEKVVDYL